MSANGQLKPSELSPIAGGGELAHGAAAAWNAMAWFEVCGARYCDTFEPEQFMYSMLTRSQRISHENLRVRDAAWLEGYERWFAERAGVAPVPGQAAPPPMFRAAGSPDGRDSRARAVYGQFSKAQSGKIGPAPGRSQLSKGTLNST